MTENSTLPGGDALQAFAQLVAVKLTYMAGGIDGLKAQLAEQIKADDKRHAEQARAEAEQTRAEERRLEVYESRWLIDHEDMIRLCGGLTTVQGALADVVSEFRGFRQTLQAQINIHDERLGTLETTSGQHATMLESQESKADKRMRREVILAIVGLALVLIAYFAGVRSPI